MSFDSSDEIHPLSMPIIVSAMTASEAEEFWGKNTLDTNDSHAVKSRSDEAVNLLKSEVDDVQDADEVTELGGQYYSDSETDTNEDEQSVDDDDDVVQIDEETEDTTKLIDEIPTSETYENEIFVKEEIVERDLPVLAKHGVGTKTYRSAKYVVQQMITMSIVDLRHDGLLDMLHSFSASDLLTRYLQNISTQDVTGALLLENKAWWQKTVK